MKQKSRGVRKVYVVDVNRVRLETLGGWGGGTIEGWRGGRLCLQAAN